MFNTKGSRLQALTAVIGVAVLLLTACSPSSTSKGASTTLRSADDEISGTVEFMTFLTYADQSLINEFEAKHPQVKVKVVYIPAANYSTNLQTRAASDGLPDVFTVQGADYPALVKAGQIANLAKVLDTASYDQSKNWRDTFVPNLLAGANQSIPAAEKRAGEAWGVPLGAVAVANVYNKEIFAKVGVDPATTFSQLLTNCQKLRAAGYTPMTLTGSVWINWWPFLALDQTLRGEPVSSFSASSPRFVKAFELVKQMVDAGCWNPSQVTATIDQEQAAFVQGKTAQFVTVAENYLQYLVENSPFPLGSSTLPPFAGVTPNRTLGGGGANVISISAKTKNSAAAVAFVKFLTSKQAFTYLAKKNNVLPSIDMPSSSTDPVMAGFIAAANGGFADSSAYMPSFTLAGQNRWDTQVLPALILGRITPEQAAAQTGPLLASK